MTISRIPSVEGGIQPTLLTTKGDLISATAASTVARLPVGSDTQILVADSTASTGLAYKGVGVVNGLTTTGDTIYSSSGTTQSRLGIGSTGQVLTVASGVPSWATPAAAGKSYSLINSGGTALTGAGTISVSSISGYDDLVIMVLGASSVSASSNVYLRLNADSGSNYRFGGPMIIGGSGYDSNNFTTELGNTTSIIRLFKISTVSTATGSGSARVSGCNTTGSKAFTAIGAGANDGGNSQRSYWYNGMYLGSSTISSVDITSDTGNFDAGTLYVYGAA